MTPEQQRIAIAEACGWSYEKNETYAPDGAFWWSKNPEFPDYLNDLNAMHEAENVLTGYPQRVTYYETLSKIVGYLTFEFAHATAAQRAEAFLRTIGKWTNNQPTEP